jgi:2-polyprenyl-3-methyl-5-hydroxy-6-metoxy-1,4-benzoquinol methylase
VNRDAARTISGRLPTPFLRHYARNKMIFDPVYAAVEERLRGQTHPLFDLGCGVGLLPFYLRELGLTFPVAGIDHDEGKIAVARDIAVRNYGALDFRTGDARAAIPAGRNVTAIDVLHYFKDEEQDAIVESIAAAIPPGGVAIVRDCVRDGSLRYRLTVIQESFSRLIRWLKAERLNFATRETIVGPFERRGFTVETKPMWGLLPYNNYLFVFKRPGSGTMNA